MAALSAAQSSMNELGGNWRAERIYCAFIEEDKARYTHLIEKINEFQPDARIPVNVYNATFVNGMQQLTHDINHILEKERRRLASTFAFIDPFGATDVPFEFVKDILSNSRSEVFLNLDTDGATRIFRAHAKALDEKQAYVVNKNEMNLDALFGDNEWTELYHTEDFREQCRRVVDLYVANLRKIPGVRYVFSFEMCSSSGQNNYYLVFATKHPLGLRKMKEAMRTIDKTGAYSFADPQLSREDKPEQIDMFMDLAGESEHVRYDDPEIYAPRIAEFFQGQTVTYKELDDYALSYTPFINPKSILAFLEKGNLIRVNSTDSRRRRTFAEEKIISIEFAPFASASGGHRGF